jgi:hypothetical protein
MSDVWLDDELDPGTPMADVSTADLADLGPDHCGVQA